MFTKFLDLPPELQGSIWRFSAASMSISDKLALMQVSKDVESWVSDLVYGSIRIQTKNRLLLVMELARTRPKLLETVTHSLFIAVDVSAESELTIRLVEQLVNLRRLYIFVRDDYQGEALLRAFNLPKLFELSLESCFNAISRERLSTLNQYHGPYRITRLHVAAWSSGPPAHLLHSFPELKQFAINCFQRPSVHSLRDWTSSIPPSVQSFALLCFWNITLDELVTLEVPERAGRRPVLVHWSNHLKREAWGRTDSLWDAIEKSLAADAGGTADDGNLILKFGAEVSHSYGSQYNVT
ncbi:hypothetical protein DL96DRAFT_900733 [Flagelloscypha sp. PMI_526]|nr:hypothetical protein DL96DRAFT_900733 [Flagelloscypha sp. PMI_526]